MIYSLWYTLISLIISDILWYTMIYYDILWYTMICYDILWYTMIYYDILWYTMIYYIHMSVAFTCANLAVHISLITLITDIWHLILGADLCTTSWECHWSLARTMFDSLRQHTAHTGHSVAEERAPQLGSKGRRLPGHSQGWVEMV